MRQRHHMMCSGCDIECIAYIAGFSLVVIHLEASLKKTDCTVGIPFVASFGLPAQLFSKYHYCIISLCIRPFAENTVPRSAYQENIDNSAYCTTGDCGEIVILVTFIVVK